MVHPVAATDDPCEHEKVERDVEDPPAAANGSEGARASLQGDVSGGKPLGDEEDVLEDAEEACYHQEHRYVGLGRALAHKDGPLGVWCMCVCTWRDSRCIGTCVGVSLACVHVCVCRGGGGKG